MQRVFVSSWIEESLEKGLMLFASMHFLSSVDFFFENQLFRKILS